MPFYILQNPDVTLAIEAFDFVHACYTACRESFAPIRDQLNLQSGDFITSVNTLDELKALCNTPAIYILTLEHKLHVYDPRQKAATPKKGPL